jgi:hypothetical protein
MPVRSKCLPIGRLGDRCDADMSLALERPRWLLRLVQTRAGEPVAVRHMRTRVSSRL